MARKRGRAKRYTRKSVKRRTRKVVSPLAHLARKVQGIDTRVDHLENKVGKIPRKYIKKKKLRKLGTLEEHGGREYWGTGE